MRSRMLFIIGVGAALGLLVGCAAGGPATPVRTSDATTMTQHSSPMRASDRMFYWREEARELHEMAERREREADVLSKGGPGTTANELAARMGSLAKQLRSAAEYADEQTQVAAREVPRGMYQ